MPPNDVLEVRVATCFALGIIKEDVKFRLVFLVFDLRSSDFVIYVDVMSLGLDFSPASPTYDSWMYVMSSVIPSSSVHDHTECSGQIRNQMLLQKF